MATGLILECMREEHTSGPRPRPLGLKLGPSDAVVTPGYPTYHLFFCFWCNYNVHIHILQTRKLEKLVSLHPCVPAPLAIMSWGS
jgi:hypothetical protein